MPTFARDVPAVKALITLLPRLYDYACDRWLTNLSPAEPIATASAWVGEKAMIS
jgi:hypothetical protein